MFYIYADGKSVYEPMDDRLTIHSPKLTLEMGKAGSFQFTVPPSHRYYSQFNQLRTAITVELDGAEIFRGRVLSNSRNFNNMRTIYCEGDLAYLVDSVQKASKFNGTAHELFRQIISRHNERVDESKRFTVGLINIENRNVILRGKSDDANEADFNYEQIVLNSIVDDWETSFDYIQSCLIGYCGGYLRTRREDGTTYIDLVKDYGNTAVQEIEFGINLLDLTEEISAEDVFTVLIPLGDDNLTIADVNNGSDELVDRDGVELYGRIVKTKVFDSVNQPSTLLDNARRYMAEHTNLPIVLTVKAVDMHLVNKSVKEIYVGDRVHVNSLPHNIVDYLTCTKIEYDLENPANNVYTFGNPRQSMTERYRKDLKKAEEDSTKKSGRGGGGGGTAAEEKTKELLDKFYDAWINVDKEAAHIDLGTLYRELKNGKAVLESQCGISLDAPSGNVNLKTLRTEFDDLGNKVLTQAASIELLNNELGAKIDLLANNHQKLKDLEANHNAEAIIRAEKNKASTELNARHLQTLNGVITDSNTKISALTEELKAQIDLEASHKRELDGKITKSNADIKQVADDLESRISLTASHVENLRTNIASIEVTANDLGSEIKLKANKTTLNSRVTEINGKLSAINAEIDTLKAKDANIESLISEKVKAILISSVNIGAAHIGAFSIDVSGVGYMRFGGHQVATQKWVEDKKYISEEFLSGKGYMTELPNYIRVDTLSANNNMFYKGWTVATEKWVRDYVSSLLENYSKKDHSHSWYSITNRPEKFPSTPHRHSFSASTSAANGHVHMVKINGVKHRTEGVSTNVTHQIYISGTTGSN